MVKSRLPTYVRRDAFTGPGSPTGGRSPGRVRSRIFKALPLAGGSREHYYHFLIGYLLPLLHTQSKRGFERFGVLDCGPLFTPILAETLDRFGYAFDVVDDGGIGKAVFVDSWDRLAWQSPEAVRATAEAVRNAWQSYTCAQADCPRSTELLIRRSAPPDYYRSAAAQRTRLGGYGTSRRAITNLDEVRGSSATPGSRTRSTNPACIHSGARSEPSAPRSGFWESTVRSGPT